MQCRIKRRGRPKSNGQSYLFPRFTNNFETHFQTVFYNIRVKGAVGKIIGEGYLGDGQPVSINIHYGFKQDLAFDFF